MQMLLVFLFVTIGAVGTLLLKMGAERVVYTEGFSRILQSTLFNAPLLTGFLMQMIPLVAWVVLLKFMPLTKLQPMIALTYVVTPVLAVIFLGEQVEGLRLAGISLIVIGVVLVGMS